MYFSVAYIQQQVQFFFLIFSVGDTPKLYASLCIFSVHHNYPESYCHDAWHDYEQFVFMKELSESWMGSVWMVELK
jgi:hypothetical protein